MCHGLLCRAYRGRLVVLINGMTKRLYTVSDLEVEIWVGGFRFFVWFFVKVLRDGPQGVSTGEGL